MKFAIVFEMDEWHCINCPVCNCEDQCELIEDCDTDTWAEQLAKCPLSLVDNQ